MFLWQYVVLCAWLAVAACQNARDFPPGFQFGAGTSAYQIEGGWNASDKGENIWDRFTHDHPELIEDGSTGDVACDSYHNWQRDVEMAAELRLDFYRFSISWARVLPKGYANYISEDGKDYYNNLINGLLQKGVEPMVTIYHWELPQRLQELGGWANPLIVDWFGEYSRVLFTLYGDRVKTWITINEPLSICDLGYSSWSFAPQVFDMDVGRYLCTKHVVLAHAKAWRIYDEEFKPRYGDRVKTWITINEPLSICDLGYSSWSFAPQVPDMDVGRYLCTKHVVLAHAKAWRIYDEEFKPRYGGRVSFANHQIWYEATSPEDEERAELARQLLFDRWAYPIYSKEGGWPPAIERIFAEHSSAEGYPTSRLPAFTEEEIKLARGAYDFMAINQYTSRVARRPYPGEVVGEFPVAGSVELDLVIEGHPDATPTGSGILPAHPEGLRKCLAWVKARYGDQEIVITENGYGSKNEGLDDEDRINYYKRYLEQLLLAVKEDGVNVTGYTAWSLMDNFEWPDGYQTMFGLYHVNFTDPSRPRTARRSARYYASVIAARSLDVHNQY